MKTHSFTSSSKTCKIIYFFLTVIAMVLLILALQKLLTAKESANIRERFYRQKEDVDVLFAGTSHSYAAFLPMDMYREYGISSYNLSTSGERFAVTYYSLKDALRYHVPKVLVIDCHAFEYGDHKNDPQVPTRCHYVFDAMPLSKLKIDGIRDVLSDMPETYMEYYFPLYYYHTRWQELSKEDFVNPVKANYAKGAQLLFGSVVAPKPDTTNQEDYVWTDDLSCEYAEKIVQLCQEYGVSVEFICVPFPCRIETQQELNQAQYIADKYDNCTYVSLIPKTDEFGFDYDTDMADEGSHVNPLGGRKVTRYVGEYLSGKYDFTDYRSQDENSIWNREYRDYTIGYDEDRKTNADYLGYLTMLYQPDYSFCIYVSDMEKANATGQLAKLLKGNMELAQADTAKGSYYCSNLGETVEEYTGLSKDDERIPSDFSKEISEAALVSIMVRNNVTGEVVETVNYSAGGRIE